MQDPPVREETMVRISGLAKTFRLHHQHGIVLPVLDGVALQVMRGECVVLSGESGAGKSTLLRCIYANYRSDAGEVLVRHEGRWVDMARAEPRALLRIRRDTIGYVSQFLRVIPRVPSIDIVAEPLLARGVAAGEARERAAVLLGELRIPPRLWNLPPATFSGGEQQRINIARGLAGRYPVLLLDEPTAALDADNRAIVAGMIDDARLEGTAIVGIFHDAEVRERVATRLHHVQRMREAA